MSVRACVVTCMWELVDCLLAARGVVAKQGKKSGSRKATGPKAKTSTIAQNVEGLHKETTRGCVFAWTCSKVQHFNLKGQGLDKARF